MPCWRCWGSCGSLRVCLMRCDRCGVRRPSWHGGPHTCHRVGGVYRIGSVNHVITEFQLEFLRADYAGLR